MEPENFSLEDLGIDTKRLAEQEKQAIALIEKLKGQIAQLENFLVAAKQIRYFASWRTKQDNEKIVKENFPK